jgi:alpha-galactosidase
LGLTPGIWTAPFEVGQRSSVYQDHPDWLVHNTKGKPIGIGKIDEKEPIYVLDVTNPEAQRYLRQTYITMSRDWGIRYFKLDFMDDSAVEGSYFKPHTTALEAHRAWSNPRRGGRFRADR